MLSAISAAPDQQERQEDHFLQLVVGHRAHAPSTV
jgi:hypothetical protein